MNIRRGSIGLFAAALIAGACSSESPSPPAGNPSPASPPPAASAATPTAQAAAPSNRPAKEFTFTVQGGTNVIATTQADASPSEKRTVVFTPMLEKTDGNLYMAALECLWNLYGKQRGLFQIGDAQMRENAALGGNAICWRISNPAADYCIFPTKDTVTGRIGVLTVWVE